MCLHMSNAALWFLSSPQMHDMQTIFFNLGKIIEFDISGSFLKLLVAIASYAVRYFRKNTFVIVFIQSICSVLPSEGRFWPIVKASKDHLSSFKCSNCQSFWKLCPDISARHFWLSFLQTAGIMVMFKCPIWRQQWSAFGLCEDPADWIVIVWLILILHATLTHVLVSCMPCSANSSYCSYYAQYF